MKHFNQAKTMNFIEALIFNILKAAVYALIIVITAYLVTAFYIGMREMPSRIDYAKNQFMESQGLKEKNQANSTNE